MGENVKSEKSSVAAASVAASLAMTTAKVAVALATGSLGVLSEALHAVIDLGATLLTWFAIRFADAPADDEHHFGHAKIESLAALVEALLLVVTALYVGFEAAVHLLRGAEGVLTPWWGFVLIGFGIAIDFWRSAILRRVALAEKSAALGADAAHFEADIYVSCAVLIGLFGVALGFPIADSVAALLVSGFILWMGISLGRENVSSLLDRAPEGASVLIKQALDSEPSVLSVEQLRLRQVGPTVYVSLNAKVPRSLSTEEIAELARNLKARVEGLVNGADVNIELEPVAIDNETAQQRVLAIAASQGLSVHHLVVQNLGAKRAISFDVEMRPSLTLAVAHERATFLEDAIRASLGGKLEVESHIEPRPEDSLASTPAKLADFSKASTALKLAVKHEVRLKDVHNVRVRQLDDGLYLHYHCRFEGEENLANCHEVLERVEARIKAKMPVLKRIVAHAEPLGKAKHRP